MRVGGIPEVVRDGHTGFLAEVGDVDACSSFSVRMLADEELYRRMSNAAIADVNERFDQRRMVRDYLSRIENLVQKVAADVAVG